MALRRTTLPGKGRALVAACPVRPGDVLLSSAPILLAVAADATATACAACLRLLTASPHPPTPCAGCGGRVSFCSPECLATAAGAPGWHSPAACAALAAVDVAGLDPDEASSARLLVTLGVLAAAARACHADAAAAVAAIESLTAPPSSAAAPAAAALAARAAAALAAAGVPPLSLHDATRYLAIEDANMFGIMLSPDPASGGRRVRGGGLYVDAALFNHDCLPSAARFDDFDAAAAPLAERTALRFVALHALPEGEEATISYVPLDWPPADRRRRFEACYGFVCGCARCGADAALEGADDGGAASMRVSGGEAGAGAAPLAPAVSMSTASARGTGDPLPDAGVPPADPGYVAVYLLKYVCPADACGGTLAPLAPADNADCVCNCCGQVRTHAEFVAALEEEEEGEEGEDSEWE